MRCWRPSGSKGCDARVHGMSWAPLRREQADILNLVLALDTEYHTTNHPRKAYPLPFEFSYAAHLWTSVDTYNCNKFANNFHTRPGLLLHALQQKIAAPRHSDMPNMRTR